jgi:hypothetical protein
MIAMAKKLPTSDRQGEFSPEKLRAFGAILERRKAALETVAAKMDSMGLKSLRIDGAKKFDLGIEKIDLFCGRCESAVSIRERQEERQRV